MGAQEAEVRCGNKVVFVSQLSLSIGFPILQDTKLMLHQLPSSPRRMFLRPLPHVFTVIRVQTRYQIAGTHHIKQEGVDFASAFPSRIRPAFGQATRVLAC